MNSPMPKPEYPSRYPIEQGGGEMNIMALLDLIARRWLFIAAIALAVTAAAIAASFLIDPTYQATAQIKIDPAARSVTDSAVGNTSPQADQSRIDTEAQILRSREIAQRVVTELNLTNDPEFRPTSMSEAATQNSLLNRTVSNFLDHLSVTRESDNYLVAVQFRSEDAEKAARVANLIAQVYVMGTVEGRTSNAANQAEFVRQRLDILGAEAADAEQQLAQYRARAGIVQGATQGTIADQQVGPVAVQLAQAESEAAAAQANLAAAQSQVARGQLGAVSSVLNSPVIAGLRSERTRATRELAQVEARYGPRHPESLRVANQLQQIDQSLRDEAERIVAGLESTARAAQARVASLRSNLNQVRGEQAQNARNSVVADSLEREVRAKQQAYDELATTLEQVNQQQRDVLPTAVIVQPASVPLQPSAPNRALFAALGMMIGLLLGFAAALLLELLTRRIRTSGDLERQTGAPFIASVPRLSRSTLRVDGNSLTPEEYAVARPMSSYVESFRIVRNSIVLSARTPPKAIAILSALPGEGKSTTALSLARVMAMGGDRTILVDCDLRRGRLGEMVGAPDQPGLSEVLTGEAQLNGVIVTDVSTGLDVLPVRTRNFTSVDLFSGEPMRALLTELRSRYDFVILDTAPLLAVADSRIVASLADTTLFVARSEKTPPRAARAAADLVRQDGTVLGGSILSMAPPKGRGMSASDPAYYSAKYRQYQQG